MEDADGKIELSFPMKARRNIEYWSSWHNIDDGYAFFGANARRCGKSYLIYFQAHATSLVAKRNKIKEIKRLDFMVIPHVDLNYEIYSLIEIRYHGSIIGERKKQCRCKLFVGPYGSFSRPEPEEGWTIVSCNVQRGDLGLMMEERIRNFIA